MKIRPPTPKIHRETADAAEKFAKETLQQGEVTLRKATGAEKLKVAAHDAFDAESVRDAVVVQGKDGSEWLLMVELDPAMSHTLNSESGVLTLAGMIPVVGAPVVAAFAIKDLIKAGVPMIKDKLAGEATDPRDRALMRMGLKHLGLSAASMATHGAAHAAHAAHAAKAVKVAHTAHKAVAATELAVAGKDLVEGGEGQGAIGPLKSALAGLQGILGVHHHDAHAPNDARVVVVSHTPGAAIEGASAQVTHKPDDKSPPSHTGPPAGA